MQSSNLITFYKLYWDDAAPYLRLPLNCIKNGIQEVSGSIPLISTKKT